MSRRTNVWPLFVVVWNVAVPRISSETLRLKQLVELPQRRREDKEPAVEESLAILALARHRAHVARWQPHLQQLIDVAKNEDVNVEKDSTLHG